MCGEVRARARSRIEGSQRGAARLHRALVLPPPRAAANAIHTHTALAAAAINAKRSSSRRSSAATRITASRAGGAPATTPSLPSRAASRRRRRSSGWLVGVKGRKQLVHAGVVVPSLGHALRRHHKCMTMSPPSSTPQRPPQQPQKRTVGPSARSAPRRSSGRAASRRARRSSARASSNSSSSIRSRSGNSNDLSARLCKNVANFCCPSTAAQSPGLQDHARARAPPFAADYRLSFQEGTLRLILDYCDLLNFDFSLESNG